jgi:hypothetical protein
MVRRKLEGPTIAPFEREAKKLGFTTYSGMGAANKIQLTGRVGFQFGDLRVDTKNQWVIIEAESAGGVTNLAKYWYILDNLWDAVGKPIRMFHLFKANSPNDYMSHLLTWDHLAKHMVDSTDGRFVPTRHTYTSTEELESIVDLFKSEIN